MENYFYKLPYDLQNYIYKLYFTKYVVNDIIQKSNKLYFTKYVLPNLNHKDWWFHTVECRANIKEYFTEFPKFIDAEQIKCLKTDFFSYSS